MLMNWNHSEFLKVSLIKILIIATLLLVKALLVLIEIYDRLA